jgi:hypothetical protein
MRFRYLNKRHCLANLPLLGSLHFFFARLAQPYTHQDLISVSRHRGSAPNDTGHFVLFADTLHPYPRGLLQLNPMLALHQAII